MRPMRLTNKQIQEIVTELRKQLKTTKTISGELNMSYKFPEPKVTEKAKLVFTQIAWQKMNELINECSKEIAWHGLVEKHDKTYTVTDILVFPQTITAATVTTDETEYSMWIAQQPDAVFNKIRFHGHSHVNMGVTPSGVDTTYQEDMLNNLNDFYIFTIFNKKGDHWCAIYDVESNVAYSKDDIELVVPGTESKTWAQEQIKLFVKEPTPVPAAVIGSKYPINKFKKKDNKDNRPKEPSSTRYTDSLMYDDDGYYYGYGWQGDYYGQK